MYDSLPSGGDRIIKLQKVSKEVLNIKNVIITEEDSEPIKLSSEVWDFDLNDKDMDKGERLYLTHCAACHRQDGSGAKDLIPPLINVDWVTGVKGRLIRSVLYGISEPIEVNSVIYDQEMPSFKNLKDEELADILTYIRNSFGNEANPIIPGEIYEERKE
jgi:cytochrome c